MLDVLLLGDSALVLLLSCAQGTVNLRNWGSELWNPGGNCLWVGNKVPYISDLIPEKKCRFYRVSHY